MKKIFVSLSFMITLGLTTVRATDNFDVNYKIKESFKKEFAGATLVKWKKDRGFQRATFVLFDHLVIAYFNTDGELLGSARNVFFYEAPMAVIKSIGENFAGIDPIEVIEVSNTEGTFYRITMETGNKRYDITASADGNLLDVFKTKKQKSKK